MAARKNLGPVGPAKPVGVGTGRQGKGVGGGAGGGRMKKILPKGAFPLSRGRGKKLGIKKRLGY